MSAETQAYEFEILGIALLFDTCQFVIEMELEIPTESLSLSPYHEVASLPAVTTADIARVKKFGIATPILVREVSRNNMVSYEVLVGVLDWLSAQQAGLPRVPVEIGSVSDSSAKLLAQHDAARVSSKTKSTSAPLASARRILVALENNRRLTRTALAKGEGKTCSAVSQELRLMRLPDEIKQLLDSGKLAKGTARALVTLPEAEQIRMARHVVAQKLSRPQAEMLVRRLKGGEGEVIPPSNARATDPDTRRLEDAMSEQLQCRARLSDGWLMLKYENNLDVLAGLLERLGITVE